MGRIANRVQIAIFKLELAPKFGSYSALIIQHSAFPARAPKRFSRTLRDEDGARQYLTHER